MIKLKDILNEEELKSNTKMAKGDYLKDVYKTGLHKVTDIYTFKGQWQVWIKPKNAPKALAGIAYDPAALKDSGKKKGGKTVWISK